MKREMRERVHIVTFGMFFFKGKVKSNKCFNWEDNEWTMLLNLSLCFSQLICICIRQYIFITLIVLLKWLFVHKEQIFFTKGGGLISSVLCSCLSWCLSFHYDKLSSEYCTTHCARITLEITQKYFQKVSPFDMQKISEEASIKKACEISPFPAI